MSKVWQEFYCTISGGGCGKYFLIRLNLAINYVVEIVCPNCGHEHQRCVEDGVIKESGRFNNKPKEKILAPKASLSDEPITAKMLKKDSYSERDGVVIKEAGDLSKRNPMADALIKERWFEIHGGK